MNGVQFAVSHDRRGAVPILRVRGEVDIYTAPRLKEAVVAALSPGVQSLAIDLSQVTLLDSTGLQVLMSAKRRTTERGGDVYILGAHGHTLRVFHLLSLEKIFRICAEADLPGS